MIKDHLKDYVTNAFRTYAAAGRPTYESLKESLIRDILTKTENSAFVKDSISRPTEAAIIAAEDKMDRATGRLRDLIAVIATVDVLKKRDDNDMIMRCLELVYFPNPRRELVRNEISDRVTYACTDIPCARATVYRKLKIARDVFAIERGLNVESSEGK